MTDQEKIERLLIQQRQADARISNQRREIENLKAEVAAERLTGDFYRKKFQDFETALDPETLKLKHEVEWSKYERLSRLVSLAMQILRSSIGEEQLRRLEKEYK